MTGESPGLDRARGQVLRWVGVYTRGLSTDVSDGRRDELAADIHDQIAESRAAGRPDGAVARSVRWRALKGAPADLMWRMSQQRGSAVTGRALDGGLLVSSLVGAVVVAFVGIVATIRGIHLVQAQWLSLATEPGVLPSAAAAAAALCGLVLLVRGRTRFVGALWMVLASQLLIVPGFGVLAQSSTVLRLAEPSMQGAVTAVSVGVGLFYLAAAIAWWPTRRAEVSA